MSEAATASTNFLKSPPRNESYAPSEMTAKVWTLATLARSYPSFHLFTRNNNNTMKYNYISLILGLLLCAILVSAVSVERLHAGHVRFTWTPVEAASISVSLGQAVKSFDIDVGRNEFVLCNVPEGEVSASLLDTTGKPVVTSLLESEATEVSSTVDYSHPLSCDAHYTALPPGATAPILSRTILQNPGPTGDPGTITSLFASAASTSYNYRHINFSPVGANLGSTFFMSAWQAASYSNDGGSTWYAQSATDYSAFNGWSDAVTDSTNSRLLWLRLGTYDMKLGVTSTPISSSTWQWYTISPATLNTAWSSLRFDRPRMEVTQQYLYISAMLLRYSNNAYYGGVVARVSLQQLAQPQTALTWETQFGAFPALAPATPSTPSSSGIYFAGTSTTSQLTVISWLDTGAFTVQNVTVPAFSSYAYACQTPDGLNPCQYLNGAMQGGYVSNGLIGFYFTAAQDATTTHPYVYVARLRESDLSLYGTARVSAPGYALFYPSIAPNADGYLAFVSMYAGGVAYPGTFVRVYDSEFSAARDVYLHTGYSSYYYRLGDMTRVRPAVPDGKMWFATTYYLSSTCYSYSTCSSVTPVVTAFGRSVDVPAVTINPTVSGCVYVTFRGATYSNPTTVYVLPGTYPFSVTRYTYYTWCSQYTSYISRTDGSVSATTTTLTVGATGGNITAGYVAPSRVACSLTPTMDTVTYGTPVYVVCTATPQTPWSSAPAPTGLLTLTDSVTGVPYTLTAMTLIPSGTSISMMTYMTGALDPASHTLVASYPGDSIYGATTSYPVTVTVIRASSNITYTPVALQHQQLRGGAAALLVCSLAPTATGSVTFYVDGIMVGTSVAASGTAAYPVVFRTGTHTLSASYSGDTYFMPASVDLGNVVVNASVPALSVSVTPSAPLDTDTVTLVCVTPPDAAGSVIFTLDSTALPPVTVVNGVASLSLPVHLDEGAYAVSAAYSGDDFFAATSTAATPFTVVSGPISIYLIVCVVLGAVLGVLLAVFAIYMVWRMRRPEVISATQSYPSIVTEGSDSIAVTIPRTVQPQSSAAIPEATSAAAESAETGDYGVRKSSSRKKSSSRRTERASVVPRQKTSYDELDEDQTL